jgi:hypothetical protein
MLNNLLKMTAITLVWKKYRSNIVALVLLIGYCWLVGIIHQDYLSYRELAGSGDSLGLSFLLKWLAWLLGLAVYFFYDSGPFNKSPERAAQDSIDTSAVIDQKQRAATDKKQRDETDPFAALRGKQKLRSKADILIEKHRE